MARVLIIDDDLMVAKMLQEHLGNEGYDVDAAHMAAEGYDSAQTNPPDLIMLDVNLPDATGFQICGRLRDSAKTKSIPIFMMTGQARFPNQQDIGKQLGANEYLIKPLDVIEVGNRVHRYIGAKRGAKKPRVVTPEAIAAPAISPLVAEPSTPVISHGPESNVLAHFDPPPTRISMPPPVTPSPLILLTAEQLLMENSHPTPPPTVLPPVLETAQAVVAPVELPAPAPELIREPEPTPVVDIKAALDHVIPMSPPSIPEIGPIQHEPVSNGSASHLESQPLSEAPGKPLVDFYATPTLPRIDIKPEPTFVPPVIKPAAVVAPAPVSEPEEERPHVLQTKAPASTARIAADPASVGVAGGVLVVHLLVSTVGALAMHKPTQILPQLSYTLGGWALLLGLVTAISGLNRIALDPRRALNIVGWTAIPIVLESIIRLAGDWIPGSTFSAVTVGAQLPDAVYWLRPLNIFEIISAVILGMMLRRQPGSSAKKALLTAFITAIAWSFTGRGFFRPF